MTAQAATQVIEAGEGAITPGAAGAPALVFTCFVFGADNGTTPPGGHIFVYPLP